MQQLSQQQLQQYVGSQFEVINEGDNYTFRGEIASLTVDPSGITVTAVWLARLEDGVWHSYTPKPYFISLASMDFHEGERGRFHVTVAVITEETTFYPMGDPTNIDFKQVLPN